MQNASSQATGEAMPALTRRAFLRTTPSASAAALVSGGVAIMATPSSVATTAAPAVEAGPIFAAIEFHRAARTPSTTRSTSATTIPTGTRRRTKPKKKAWDAFATAHPTTMAGVEAMVAYALHSPMGYEEDNLREVLRTIVVMTAKFVHRPAGLV